MANQRLDPEKRPSPDALLEAARRDHDQAGKLKIFVGAAPGVGKTYEMLQSAHAKLKAGIDVVVGVVETHGRAETEALLVGLEVLPRKRLEYKDQVLGEMDLDALIARRPQLALVDELAHTNAPGSRHPKRYQDVEEVLRAGINVITTLNIQHLESLHEIVHHATGVRVKERIPDYVVATADQIVNVDVSAEDLRERLQAGKIYPADRIATAMENFFAVEKLTHLRELAMEEIAFRLDRRRREREQESGSPVVGSARIMVCLSSRSPRADALLRKAARIADRLGAPWFAVYVQTPRESPTNIDAATQRRVANNLELARQLGGTSMAFKGTDLVNAIDVFVKEYGITHVVLGRSNRPWYSHFFRQSVLERLLRTIPDVDVVVVENSATPQA